MALPCYLHLNTIISDAFLNLATKTGGVLPSAGASGDWVVSRLSLAGRRSLPHDSESRDLGIDKENYYRRANCLITQRAIKWLNWDKVCMSYTLQIAASFRPFQWHKLEIGRAKIIMFCHGILGNWGSGIFPGRDAHFSRWRLCFDFKHCWLCTGATFF